MSYRKIPNLYADDKIMLFKTIFSTEKVHGTSAKVTYSGDALSFFSGGAKHEHFESIFDHDALLAGFRGLGHGPELDIVVCGEAYGGKMQGMSATYGKDLQFIVFEVKIGHHWLSVPNAAEVAENLGLEFVPWKEIPATLEAIDAERDADSEIAVRRGMGVGKKREGVVLRPPVEVRLNSGERIAAKHKREEFRESRRKQPRPGDLDKQAALKAAGDYAHEYVVTMRLRHVLDKMPGEQTIENMKDVILAMVDDVLTEEPPPAHLDKHMVRKEIGKRTAYLFKAELRHRLLENK